MRESLLEVRDLGVRFGARRSAGGGRWALDGVDLSVATGDSVAIVGESGCGKSTLARAMAGLIPATRGRILLRGEPVGVRRSRAQRRTVQLVFQDPYSSLNPRMTTGQAIGEVLHVHRMCARSEIAARTRELLDLVKLPGSVARAYPRHLSGGQRQRVSLARALAVAPALLIADEPVSALDVSAQAAVLNVFADLRAELGLTLVLISHNLAVVRQVSDLVAVMRHGAVVETGRTDDVLIRPRHPYTQSLLDAVPSPVPREPIPG
ncbi:ATP-binding cassette domain-containing protein [Amycolatopsis anabasis]|uniref:ATP-binding cassette domain-containing protein n=1 Tax=Amycolatopsis anabasis TaxID=1840409 RepID=UPI00131BAF56|nr:ATP-binding cassette domain-containing protein [Amycolatopsis anabasis]